MAIGTTGTKSSIRRRRAGATKIDNRHSDNTLRLLIVVDASEASKRVLQYLGRTLARRNRVEFHLACIASRVPAGLLESGGSEIPEREEEIESDLRSAQVRWIAVNDRKPERVLRGARAALQQAGITPARIHSCVSSPLDARTVPDEVLVLARDLQCRTVVVGHRAHSWLRGLGGGHLAEQLVRSAKGFAVWVID
ncbi:MAG: universal stress protein [Gammaproteobacteria bacterium]